MTTIIQNIVDIGDPDGCGSRHYLPYRESVTLTGPIFEIDTGHSCGSWSLPPGRYRFALLEEREVNPE